MRSIFGLICRGLFEGGGFCVWGGAGPVERWKCSALTHELTLWCRMEGLAAAAACCEQGVVEFSGLFLGARRGGSGGPRGGAQAWCGSQVHGTTHSAHRAGWRPQWRRSRGGCAVGSALPEPGSEKQYESTSG